MFYVRDAARLAVHNTIESVGDEIVKLSRSLHDANFDHDRRALIATILESADFEVQLDVDGITGTIRAVRERRDATAERKGLRHAHMAYLADLPDDPASWANDGANLSVATTVSAAIGLAASLAEEHEHGIITFMAGRPGWKVEAAAKGLFEPFDAALGVRAAAAGDGYCYTIDHTGDRLGSLLATVSFSGGQAAANCAFLVADIPSMQERLSPPSAIRVIDTASESARFEITGASRSNLIEVAVELKDHADAAAADGTTVDLDLGAAVDDMIVNRILIRRVKTYGDTYRLPMDLIVKSPAGPPSDWGNVSYITPSAEVAMRITDDPALPGTLEFGALTATDFAHAQALLLSECVAMTGIDVLRDSTYRAIADDQLIKALAARGLGRAHRRWLGVHPVRRASADSDGERRRGPTVSDFRMVNGPDNSSPPPPSNDDDEQPDKA